MDSAAQAPSETNRDRVRRLLFAPLAFRHEARLTQSEARAIEDPVADDLAYLTDESLAALARALVLKGDGHNRNKWPGRATFVAFAMFVQPLPLEQDQKLLSWFASVEGQRMVQDGTLVETWGYIERWRIPPYTPEARRLVLESAQVAARRLKIVAERLDLGHPVDPSEREFARRYQAETDRLTALVARLAAERAGKGVAA